MDTFVNNNQYFFQYLVITGIKEKTVLPITEIQVKKEVRILFAMNEVAQKKTRGINLNILLTCT